MIYKKKIFDIGDHVVIREEGGLNGAIHALRGGTNPPPEEELKGVVVEVDYGFPTNMPSLWERRGNDGGCRPEGTTNVRYLVEINQGRHPWTWFGEFMVAEDPNKAIMRKIKEAGE